MKPVIALGTFPQARVLAAGLAIFFIFGLTACGGGGSSTAALPSGGGGGGGGGSPGFIFVANPNSGNLSSYGYNTSTGTISSLINFQSPATFQSSANHINMNVDTTNGLVFMTTPGTTTTTEWSYLYSLTGQMSGAQHSQMLPPSGTTPGGGAIDTLNHFAIAGGKTSTSHSITSYPYSTSTGAVSTTGSASSVTGQIVSADLQHHLIFAINGTTVSSYSFTQDVINGTAHSATVSALSGATGGGDNALDTANGILFLFINSSSGSSIVPIPYNTTTGVFGTPAAATTFTSTGIAGSCSTATAGGTNGVDPANKLLFVSDNSNGKFGMYSYDATTGAIGSTTLWMPSNNISPGYCASVDTGNRIMFFLVNSTPTSPYQVSSFTYPANGNGITPVNTVSGVTSGATFQEVMAINH